VDFPAAGLWELDAKGGVVEKLAARDEKLHEPAQALEPVARGERFFLPEQVDDVGAL
jgi:hypothetical protein